MYRSSKTKILYLIIIKKNGTFRDKIMFYVHNNWHNKKSLVGDCTCL